jgi:hypothetical protein
MHEQLAIRVYELATKLWYRLMPDTSGGHPGVAGPPGGDEPWDMVTGNLTGAITALEQIVPHAPPPKCPDLPDPIDVIHRLFEAGHLEDHFYAVRDSECLGWDGPRMLAWGKACEDADNLMKARKPQQPKENTDG